MAAPSVAELSDGVGSRRLLPLLRKRRWLICQTPSERPRIVANHSELLDQPSLLFSWTPESGQSQQALIIENALIGLKASREAYMSRMRRLLLIDTEAASEGRVRASDEAASGGIRAQRLRYYSNSGHSTGARQSTPQFLDFRLQQFVARDLPEGIRQDMRDMKLESNRLASFSNSIEFAGGSVTPESLAADGFYWLRDRDRVKCAFCKGILHSWQAGDSVRCAHRERYSTCPFVLQLEVGNQRLKSEAGAKPEACAEAAETRVECVQCSIRLPMTPDLREASAPIRLDPQPVAESATVATDSSTPAWLLARLSASLRHCGPPVPAEVAERACSAAAEANLAALAAAGGTEPQEPSMSGLGKRLDSLAKVALPLPAWQLASAGFHAVEGGATACYWCGVTLRVWQEWQDAWVEHARWSPRCGHLLSVRGCQFVLEARRRLPPFAADASDLRQYQDVSTVDEESARWISREVMPGSRKLELTPEIADKLGEGRVQYRVEPRDIKGRTDLPIVRDLFRLGFGVVELRVAMEIRIRAAGDDFRSPEAFADAVWRLRRLLRQSGLDAESYLSDWLRTRSSQAPAAVRLDADDSRSCRVCMENLADVVLLSCGHLCCCSQCEPRLKTCPICRAFVRGTILIRLR